LENQERMPQGRDLSVQRLSGFAMLAEAKKKARK
jgi:hypothetical protein